MRERVQMTLEEFINCFDGVDVYGALQDHFLTELGFVRREAKTWEAQWGLTREMMKRRVVEVQLNSDGNLDSLSCPVFVN